jgi:hypothetical protein
VSISDCGEIVQEYVQALGSQFSCGTLENRVWIVSPYTFPDGDLIGISLIPLNAGRVTITDLGETLRHLADQAFDPMSTPRGQYVMAEVIKQNHVELDRGMIVKSVNSHQIGQGIQDVLMASFKIAQLLFLARSYRPATFDEEISAFLAAHRIDFRERVQEVGLSGRRYYVDFAIPGRTKMVFVEALSPGLPAGIYASVNAAVRMWVDLPPNGHHNVTLLNDQSVNWKSSDVSILDRVSTVYRWNNREDAFLQALQDE